MRTRWLGAAVAGAVGMLGGGCAGPGSPADGSPEASETNVAAPAVFVAVSVCGECHEEETAAWRGSHHDLAMQPANARTVLGDFDDAVFTAPGVTARFFRDGDRFRVETEGSDGRIAVFPVDWTFGVWPLQQVLVPFPDGRLQPLGVAWDARSLSEGGQHWYALAMEPPGSPLHWTGRDQTWNYMCAECHSTGLRKGYDLGTDTYGTTWAEVDVSCEACHGPGSVHVERARAAGSEGADGLLVDLSGDGATWDMQPATGIARRSIPRTASPEVDACGRCHALRVPITADYTWGVPLLDTHRPRVLEEGLYHPDGQILGEVYEWGSFLQSRMARAGVTCSDCHDPHTLRLRAPGNAVCARCHLAQRFDSPDHHFHEPGTEGAACIACHMPSRTYMGVDRRFDHSIRVPRPDLSEALGTPDACSGCHPDRGAAWAAARVVEHFGPTRRDDPHYGVAIRAGRTGAPDAPEQLAALLEDPDAPGVARATAAALLRAYPTEVASRALEVALGDPDPVVRVEAVGASEILTPASLLLRVSPLLDDPVLAVRIEAARVLAPASPGAVDEQQLEAALEAYRAAQSTNAERPESHVALGLVDLERGAPEEARREYETALRLDPTYVPGWANLADLYRALGRDDLAEEVLEKGLAKNPDAAALHHALGLLRVRQGRLEEAVEALRRAVALEGGVPAHATVLGVALHAAGRDPEAIAVLEEAQGRNPSDRDLLYTLSTISRDAGRREEAHRWAARLAAVAPWDERGAKLLADLERSR